MRNVKCETLTLPPFHGCIFNDDVTASLLSYFLHKSHNAPHPHAVTKARQAWAYCQHTACTHGSHMMTLNSRLFYSYTERGVLDEPYSAKSAQRSRHNTGPPGYIGWTVDTVPAYVDLRV
jgi:hypothetical protein